MVRRKWDAQGAGKKMLPFWGVRWDMCMSANQKQRPKRSPARTDFRIRLRVWSLSYFNILPSVQSVQLLSRVWLFATPWTAARQASLSLINSWSLLKLISTESVMPSNHLILCCPLLLLPSVFPSIRVFSSESALHIRWPKYWSFSFSISLSNEYSGLISFRNDSFDLLAVQGTLKSLLQHHSSKASVLQCSASFMVQLSHLWNKIHDCWKNHSFD